MSGRLLKELIRAHRAGDEALFRVVVEALASEEDAKRHGTLARELRQLAGPPVQAGALAVLPDPPRDRDTGVPLAQVRAVGPGGLDALVLNERLRSTLSQVIEQVPMWPAFKDAGISCRNRVLLYGPPGCGKTSLAAAVASALGWPLVTARVDSLVSSYLGQTATNLREIFDFADSCPVVLLLDEFDALGKERDLPSDHGEVRRVVNAILQMIDGYAGPSLIFAATNHQQVLDAALWRRFDEVLEVPLPDAAGLRALLSRGLDGVSEHTIGRAAASLEALSLPFAAGAHAVDAARRAAFVAGRPVSNPDVQDAVNATASRRWL